MPEGPEVRRMGVDLSMNISGKIIEGIEVLSGRYTKKPIDGFARHKSVFPTKCVGVGVHGKFLYVLTESGVNIWSTLGMTGQWSDKKTNHSRVCLNLSEKKIFFNDQRNFGTFKLVYGPKKLEKKLMSLGPDIFSDNTTLDVFLERVGKKAGWNITKVLMDQSIIAGIGNYIKSEALWLAGINPLKNVSDLSGCDLEILYKAVRDVSFTSYEQGGATFLTHKNFSGELGDYSSRFLCYNRKVDAEGHSVIKTTTPDGRTTHWSPDKQK